MSAALPDAISRISCFCWPAFNTIMSQAGPSSEREPLLPSNASVASADQASSGSHRARDKTRTVALFSIVIFVLIWVSTFSGFRTSWYTPAPQPLPKDPLERARAILEQNPLIDGVSKFRSRLSRNSFLALFDSFSALSQLFLSSF